MPDKFIGFYPSRPFWAGKKLDLSSINWQDIRDLQRIGESLYRVEFEYKFDASILRIHKDGLLTLRIKELEEKERSLERPDSFWSIFEWWSEYLDYLNCIYLILDSAVLEVLNISYLELFEITNRDAFRVTSEEGGRPSFGIRTESIASLFQMAYFHPYEVLRIYSGFFDFRLEFQRDVFDNMAEKFSKILSERSLIPLLSGIAKSISQYKIGNYSTGLILSWFVIESMINAKWSTLVNDKKEQFPNGYERINADRKEMLLKGRDYTISVISNILELAEAIPFIVFRKIDKIRGYRNKIVHQEPRYICKAEHCSEAIMLALELVLDGKPIRIMPNLSLRLNG